MLYDDPKVSASVMVGIIGAIVVFVIIVLLQALFFQMQEEEMHRKVYSQAYEELRALDAGQLETLNSYGWIDQANGIAHIPIDRAMELMANEAVQ